jgi:hypothetical protein
MQGHLQLEGDRVIDQIRVGKKYFKDNPNYNYLLNNCGDYVQAMVDLRKPNTQLWRWSWLHP